MKKIIKETLKECDKWDKLNMKKRDYPEERKLMTDCPKCGQEVNVEFVEKVVDDIVKQARQQERERKIEEVIRLGRRDEFDDPYWLTQVLSILDN